MSRSSFVSAPRSLVAAAVLAAGTLAATTANAATFSYVTSLSGAAEAPPNGSPASGFATVVYDNVARTLSLNVSFSGLLGTTTAAHIHAATPTPFFGTSGVATTTPTFAGWPVGAQSATYSIVLDLTQSTSYNASYITANGGTTASAETALTNAIAAGRAYLNIHSTAFPGGEIRGFLPAPGAAMTLGGFLGIAAMRRRRN